MQSSHQVLLHMGKAEKILKGCLDSIPSLSLLMFFDFLIYQKLKGGGTLIKCLISMLSNLAETLHSSAKLKKKKKKQVAKI